MQFRTAISVRKWYTSLMTENLHTVEFLIYETWLDSFGHVNHAKYLELYEQARWDWLSLYQISTETIQQTGIGPVVLEVKVRYLRELKAREHIRISTRLRHFHRKTFQIEQQMLRLKDGLLASELHLTGGILDLRERRLITPPPEWRQALRLQDGD